MKIRNIQEYVKQWSEYDSLHLLGKDEEPFLDKINGEETSLDAWIEGIASFASNAQEQLFYELVQNAFDAEADSLMFFMNKEYLVVLNNGLPFFTDEKKNKRRDGQLYNFLAKRKSLKHNDEKKLGNFGQGSKLLYTLIADTGLKKSAELMVSAIKKQKKGPYLISWANDDQLQNFLLDRNKWEWGEYDDWQNSMLIAKILMSYYPIAPGVDEDLFSSEELSNVIKAFDSLVDPRRNINRLKQGTALIVPLGKGQYERINDEDNLKHVRERLGDFASIQGDKLKNSNNNLQFIQVFGEDVPMRKVKSVFINVDIDGKLEEYHFAFNPEFSEEGVVNFYMSLPIHETRYGLGFIIDSNNFDPDDSRQRIKERDKTEKILTLVFESLKDKLHDIIKNDPVLWEYIYQCLLETKIPDIEDCRYVKNVFYAVLQPLVASHVRTSDGKFMHNSLIWHALNEAMVSIIPLEKIGISKHWVIKEDYKKLKENHNISITPVGIPQVINEANQSNLTAWIKSLSNVKYLEFVNLVIPSAKVISRQVFRSNQDNVYSWGDLCSNKNVFFIYKESDKHYFAISNKIEYIPTTFLSVKDYSELEYWNTVLAKIKDNITFFSDDTGKQNFACSLLKAMCTFNYMFYTEKVRDIALLKNVHGDRVAFRHLFTERPQDTILFDEFVVQQIIPSAAQKEWFESKNNAWSWLKQNTFRIKSLSDWGEYAEKYLDDIKKAYNAPNLNHPVGEHKIEIYLNEHGEITEPYKALLNAQKLNNVEYEQFTNQFKSKRFVPTRFRDKLIESPFTLNLAENRLSIDDYIEDETVFPLSFLPIIFKLRPSILNNRYVKCTPNGYSFVSFKGRNYLDVGIDDDVRKVYNDMGYHAIPKEIAKYIGADYKEDYAANNKEMLLEAIESSKLRAYLLPLVDEADKVVKDKYFDSLVLSVTGTLNEKSIEWRVIKYAMQHVEWKDKVFDAIRYNGVGLPDIMLAVTVECNGVTYSIYDLLAEVKQSNETIDKFLEKLPEPYSFRQSFYDGNRTEQKKSVDVYNAIPCDSDLTVKQLEFCLDYAYENSKEEFCFGLEDSSELKKALEMIYERKFTNFNDYFAIPQYDSELHVYADKTLLLEEEYLPPVLENWFREHPDAYILLRGLLTEETGLIALRKAVRDNSDYFISNVEDGALLTRTIKWVGKHNILYASPAYRSVMALINTLPNTLSNVPLLRFTDKVKVTDGDEQKNVPILRLSALQDNIHYLIDAYEVSRKFFLQQYLESSDFFNWVKKQNICMVPQSDFLTEHKLNKKLRVEANQIAVENDDCKEWSGILYDKWKESYPKYRILLSRIPIVISFTLTCAGDIIYKEQIGNKEFGFKRSNENSDNYVMIREASTTKLVMDNLKICKDEPSLDWFRPAYIELSDLLLNMIQEKQDVDAILSPNYSSGGGSTSGKPRGKGNLQVPDDMLAAVKSMINKLSAEEINAIDERWEDIRKALQAMDEEEPTSKVRAIIGYIGEQIYEEYLTKRGIQHEYVAEQEGEYDFKVEQDGETVYVDVKTNLYSLEDGTAPFYIHKSQSSFMQKHPEAKFRIVRVSLKDINVVDDYISAKALYGDDADPATNAALRKKCQKIAKNYWESATIEVFDSKSPEYGLSITRLKS